jgi:hypothetical protein
MPAKDDETKIGYLHVRSGVWIDTDWQRAVPALKPKAQSRV